jgi:hypothetical protein
MAGNCLQEPGGLWGFPIQHPKLHKAGVHKAGVHKAGGWAGKAYTFQLILFPLLTVCWASL